MIPVDDLEVNQASKNQKMQSKEQQGKNRAIGNNVYNTHNYLEEPLWNSEQEPSGTFKN